MPNTRQSACERLTDVVNEVVVRQAGISQPNCKDDEVGEEVGCAEGVRIDVDGAKDGRMRDAGEQGRVERDDLVIERADDGELDARVQDDAQAAE